MTCEDWRHELYQHCPTCNPQEFQQGLANAPEPQVDPPVLRRLKEGSRPEISTGYSDTY